MAASRSSPRPKAARAGAAASSSVKRNGLKTIGVANSLKDKVSGLAREFGLTDRLVAETAGIEFGATAAARRAEERLRHMADVVERVSRCAGGPYQAMSWYRAQPLSAFGDRTAESLVKSGQAAALRDYLNHIALGGFA